MADYFFDWKIDPFVCLICYILIPPVALYHVVVNYMCRKDILSPFSVSDLLKTKMTRQFGFTFLHYDKFSSKNNSNNSPLQFQEILKPNYNSVDLAEVELVESYMGSEPRANDTQLLAVRRWF